MAMRRTAPTPVIHRPGSGPRPHPRVPKPRQLDGRHRHAGRRFAWESHLTWDKAGAVPRWLYRGYHQVNAGDLAAAIAYHALVALVPSFLMLVSFGGYLLNRDEAVLRMALNAAVWALPSDTTREALQALLQARENHGWLGVASFIGFAWVGTGFMSSLARGMNRVYQVPNRHYVFQRTRAFFVVVTFAILFQLATLAAILPTFVMGREFVTYFQPWLLTSDYGRILSYAVAITAAMCLFLLLYWGLPNAGQKFKDVWPGTIVAGALFLGIVQIFPIYIRLFHQLNRTATIFGFVSILVFWFYLLAHVLLFGTYVNVTWQCHRRRGRVPANCPTIGPDDKSGASSKSDRTH